MIVVLENTEDTITVLAKVLSVTNQNIFQVQIHDSDRVLEAHRSGKMQLHDIHVMRGDEVKVVIHRHNLNKGRITFRSNANRGHNFKKEYKK